MEWKTWKLQWINVYRTSYVFAISNWFNIQSALFGIICIWKTFLTFSFHFFCIQMRLVWCEVSNDPRGCGERVWRVPKRTKHTITRNDDDDDEAMVIMDGAVIWNATRHGYYMNSKCIQIQRIIQQNLLWISIEWVRVSVCE